MRINLNPGELCTYIIPSAAVLWLVAQYAGVPYLKGFMRVDAVMTSKDVIPGISYDLGQKSSFVVEALFTGDEEPEIIRKTPSDTQN
jgi:hypothetical protein